MQPERTFYVGSHPCQAYRKTSYNGWAWGLLSMGSLKFRQLESDGANGELKATGSTIRMPHTLASFACTSSSTLWRSALPTDNLVVAVCRMRHTGGPLTPG